MQEKQKEINLEGRFSRYDSDEYINFDDRDGISCFFLFEHESNPEPEPIAAIVFERDNRFEDSAELIMGLGRKPDTMNWIEFIETMKQSKEEEKKHPNMFEHLTTVPEEIEKIRIVATNVNFIFLDKLIASPDGFYETEDSLLEECIRMPENKPELARFWAFAAGHFWYFCDLARSARDGDEDRFFKDCSGFVDGASELYNTLIQELSAIRDDLEEQIEKAENRFLDFVDDKQYLIP